MFGGAFDPPHLGHVLCAAYALAVARPAELWVLPSARHPYGKAMTPFAERIALCRAAFAGLAGVTVREDESENTAGYTITLVEHLRTRHPGVRFALVGGSDTAQDLGNWHRGGELRALVDLIAVPRRGFDDHPAALPAIASRDIRAQLARGETCAEVLPAAVLDLIRARGLYGANP